MKEHRRFCLLYIGIFLLLLCLKPVDVHAEEEKGRILFISSYSYAWDTVQIQIEGIKEAVGNQAVIDYEFMDTKRVNDQISAQQFYEGLAYRLSKVEPYHVVILGDDAAFLFATEHKDDLFEGIPLVFEGVNDVETAMEWSKDPQITGVLEKLSVEKNIDFGLTLYPEAKKVIAILDNSVTGEAERKSFFSYAEKYPNLDFMEINTSELTTHELRSRLNQVGRDSILIYIVMTEDASGKQYTNQESIKLIVDNCRVPALRMVEGGIGEGLLGGNVVSMHRSGAIASQIALDIINGAPSGEINVVVESPNVYCIDEQVMKKFELDLSLIPEGAVIINHQKSFWESNKEVLIPGSMLIAGLVTVILWALYDNLKRRRLLGELEEARKIMETASQHDFLTGLSNRSKFMEDLERYIASQTPCTIMMIDVDCFKQINDTYGHTAGDEALQQLAERLRAMQTQILTPYRFAGDEFIILLKSTQKKIVDKSAFQCHQLFEMPFVFAGEKRKVGGSIGIASYPQDAADGEQLIVCADDAMYQVKNSGKNSFAFYSKKQEVYQ